MRIRMWLGETWDPARRTERLDEIGEVRTGSLWKMSWKVCWRSMGLEEAKAESIGF